MIRNNTVTEKSHLSSKSSPYRPIKSYNCTDINGADPACMIEVIKHYFSLWVVYCWFRVSIHSLINTNQHMGEKCGIVAPSENNVANEIHTVCRIQYSYHMLTNWMAIIMTCHCNQTPRTNGTGKWHANSKNIYLYEDKYCANRQPASRH